MKPFYQRSHAIWLTVGLVIIFIVITAFALTGFLQDDPIKAPEADAVLKAQRVLPFQILIPAYLPAKFERAQMEINTELTGPEDQALVQLVYFHPLGVTLTLTEWIPVALDLPATSNSMDPSVRICNCICRNLSQSNRLMVDVGPVRITGETSDPLILSPEHVRVILTTLAPAGGLDTYSTIENVPLSAGLPPAEEIPVNASGVQEVVLVVTPSGYTPVHFSVKKGIPVRLIFRQLGEVGCGNELYVNWGDQKSEFLLLENPGDTEVLEFTPQKTGEFVYHCSHFIFQGVMTVVD